MLISPPFLPVRTATQSETAWLDQAMPVPQQNYIPSRGDLSIAGNYPVSQEFGWHGGQHLVAPMVDGVGLVVRSIADGIVVYVRRPRTLIRPQGDANISTPSDPLHYGRMTYSPTNDGVVLIRHTTDIGAAGNTPINVTYYSLYCHLDRIPDSVVLGQAIRRKDEIGAAGYVYGNAWQIHMEILCDDANLQRLVGRSSGDLPLTADGRSDIVYGEIYIHLPVGTQVFAECPSNINPVAHRAGNGTPTTLTSVCITEEDLIVGIYYGQGDSRQGGNATVTTCRPDGTPIGLPFVEPDAEYTLHAKALEISQAYPATSRPATNAVYELLRYGRAIGADQLTPANVPHWRQIRTPTGSGWVNLNADNTHKFSDADFPHWKGWNLIDASQTRDSRCDNVTIMGWFDTDKDGKISEEERTDGHQNLSVQEKMKYAICKFPSEWAENTIEQRWAWLNAKCDDNPESFEAGDFDLFKKHATALSFWEKAQARDANLPGNPWLFQPRAFVEQLRSFGWANPLRTCTLRTAGLGPTGARFGMVRNGGTRPHQGIDLAAIPGTPIYAVANGKIESINSVGLYGNTIVLRVDILDLPIEKQRLAEAAFPNQDYIRFFYTHLNRIDVSPGDKIYPGMLIGLTGATGNASDMTTIATGAHLHFEFRTGAANTAFGLGLANRSDPLVFIEALTNG